MSRYVLKFGGARPRQADLDAISRSGAVILDRFGGAMLVDASEEVAADLRRRLAEWTVTPETTYLPPRPADEGQH